jgi:glycosyltransferase involved in cell wall biosynthesis
MVVSIICTCYNQASFLREAIQSVLLQTHAQLDIWVADDASNDGSQELIRKFEKEYPQINIYLNSERWGHTRLFNHILPMLKGEYVIDLAADDLLLPDRVAEGLKEFIKHPECGVNFTNAELIDDKGSFLKFHYPVDKVGRATVPIPAGDIFAELVGHYYVNPVTMMVRKSLLEELSGYDATLSYEDFDFWVRSSRLYPYCYTDKVLVKKRIHSTNYSLSQYSFGSPQMLDTYRICKKIKAMIHTPKERHAFYNRLGFEMRQCIRTGNLRLLARYLTLF